VPRADELPVTILLVDDTPTNLVALKAMLTRPDYQLLTAPSGEEALKIALQEHLDIILLDVLMPGMDGFEVARYLKATEHTRNIPIVFLTAVASAASYVYRAYEVGAVDYVIKPLDSEIVKRKVAVFADLVRQKAAIARQGDRRYRRLVEGIDHVIAWTTDESLRLTFVSRQAAMILGYPAEYFLQPDFWKKHLHADDCERVLMVFREALERRVDLTCSHRLVAADDRVRWFHTGVAGERGLDDGPAELHGFSVDITDLQRAEEEARSAKQARDDLLSIVAHFRDPLASIERSAAELGRALSSTDEPALATKLALATHIVRSAERMERLIGQLLDLGTVDAIEGSH
jgi:PAS domain S-box-containing protein